MKRKILIILSAILIFGMVAAVYAYQTNSFAGAAASCCCKHAPGDQASTNGKDSCPMADCCKDGKCDCCKDGSCTCDCCKDSCPMKDGQTASTMQGMDHASCPHMKS